MCNTFAVYFQIFATFGYKKVKNSENLHKKRDSSPLRAKEIPFEDEC